MIISLSIFLAISIISTIYIQDLYNLDHLGDGSFVPGPNFEMDTKMALRGSAATSILTYLGLWIIKLNFLLFFYRLGHKLPKFRVLWWCVFVLVVASGIVQLGLIEYNCMLTDFNSILVTCTTIDSLYETRRRIIASVTLDIISDFLSIFHFPSTFHVEKSSVVINCCSNLLSDPDTLDFAHELSAKDCSFGPFSSRRLHHCCYHRSRGLFDRPSFPLGRCRTQPHIRFLDHHGISRLYVCSSHRSLPFVSRENLTNCLSYKHFSLPAPSFSARSSFKKNVTRPTRRGNNKRNSAVFPRMTGGVASLA